MSLCVLQDRVPHIYYGSLITYISYKIDSKTCLHPTLRKKIHNSLIKNYVVIYSHEDYMHALQPLNIYNFGLYLIFTLNSYKPDALIDVYI